MAAAPVIAAVIGAGVSIHQGRQARKHADRQVERAESMAKQAELAQPSGRDPQIADRQRRLIAGRSAGGTVLTGPMGTQGTGQAPGAKTLLGT